jgi:hypothetical protein
VTELEAQGYEFLWDVRCGACGVVWLLVKKDGHAGFSAWVPGVEGYWSAVQPISENKTTSWGNLSVKVAAIKERKGKRRYRSAKSAPP